MDLLEKLEMKKSRDDRINLIQFFSDKDFIKLLCTAVCTILVFAGLIYLLAGRNIYFWDDATYWEISQSIATGKIGGDGLWRTVYESIGTQDYNYLAALPTAMWMKLFGQTRLAYESGILVLYFAPIQLVLYCLVRKLSKTPCRAYLLSVFMLPSVLFLSYTGFIDIGGLLIALICYNLYYTKDGVSDKPWRFAVIGALLVLIMVFRRYFAFFAVSFVTAVLADCIIYRRNRLNAMLMLFVTAFLLCGALRPFLTNILLRDYGTLYSGYKFSLGTDIKLITRYFGILFIAAALFVPVICARRKNDYRPAFLWIQLMVCALMFMSTQSHSQQHLLLYIPALIMLIILAADCLEKRTLLAAVLIAALNTGSTFIPRKQPGNIQEIKHAAIIPTFSMLPEKRTDTQTILYIKRALDNKIPMGKICSVLSSSFVINDSIIRNAELSLGEKRYRDGDYIISLPEVDSRDYGRLNEIYNADYILVASPAQTHLAPGRQTITEEAVKSFTEYTDIARSFEEEYDFACSIDGIDVKLFRRTKTVDTVAQKEFEARLFKE